MSILPSPGPERARHGALVSLLALVACGGSPPASDRPKSASDLYLEADRHDAEAGEHESMAAETASGPPAYVCGDTALVEQSTSGTERLTPQSPCWSPDSDHDRHRRAAERLHAEAAEHRHAAAALLDAEARACAGLAPEDLEHSPFWHRGDIATVEAELDGTRVRGARVRFRPLPGLSVEWMKRALTCHQAHAAVRGFAPTYMSYCPATVAGAAIDVRDDGHGLLVIITGETVEAATIVYARAEALLAATPEQPANVTTP